MCTGTTHAGYRLHYISVFRCLNRKCLEPNSSSTEHCLPPYLCPSGPLTAHAFLMCCFGQSSDVVTFQKPLVTCPTSGQFPPVTVTECPTPSSCSLAASPLRGLISSFWKAALLLTGCAKGRNATKKVGLKTGQGRGPVAPGVQGSDVLGSRASHRSDVSGPVTFVVLEVGTDPGLAVKTIPRNGACGCCF